MEFPDANERGEETSMIDYYNKEDFKSITIGESTWKDVFSIAPTQSMQITSYGGYCDFPMQTGGCIRIKFQGKNMIVWAIEEID